MNPRVSTGELERPRAREGAFERLEPCAGKLASTVLRGLGGGNAARLPDVRSHYLRDVTFGEDASLARTGKLPQVLALERVRNFLMLG